MKIAVSIPDPIFAEAERLAKRFRLTRSGLYARAVSEYLEKHGADRITELANAEADALGAAERGAGGKARLASYRTILQQTEW